MQFQAVETSAALFANAVAGNGMAAGFAAMLLIDESMHVVSADATGRAVLAADTGLRLSLGRLCTGSMGQNESIRRAVGEGQSIADLRVGALTISVFPMSAMEAGDRIVRQAIAIVRSAEPSAEDNIEAVRAACGLTGAETETLRLIYKGLNTVEVAGVMGIAKSTVRTHLQKVFAKTETSRQSELVHFVATYRSH